MPCIIDSNKCVETPIKDILETLRQQLALMHIDKLKQIEYKGMQASLTCPVHKDGKENRPSCSILLVDKGKYPAGTVHCFTCDYKANLVKFVADCMGISYRSATEWLLGFINYSIVTEKRAINELFPVEIDNCNYNSLPTISCEDLKRFDYIHPYMFQRRLTDEIINKFEVGYDPETDCLTFPVYVNGVCLFVAKRKVKFKQFIMPAVTPKPIYGLDYLTDDEVIICESVINALTCWAYGKQAVALFGTGSEYQTNILQHIPQRKIILALDPDNAGKMGAYKIKKALGKTKIVRQYNIPYGKDINDLTKDEFDNLEEVL